MTNLINVLIWGDVPSVYTTSRTIQLSCNHQRIGDYLITTDLQVLPLPGATLPADQTDNAGKIYPPKHYEVGKFPLNDGVKKVVLIKDSTTNSQYYVDYDSYTANIVNCNRVPYAVGCPAVDGLVISSITSSSAVATWNDAGGDGYEYQVTVFNTPPDTAGSFTQETTVDIESIFSGTTYYFWIRTICPGGILAEWTSVSFVTP